MTEGLKTANSSMFMLQDGVSSSEGTGSAVLGGTVGTANGTAASAMATASDAASPTNTSDNATSETTTFSDAAAASNVVAAAPTMQPAAQLGGHPPSPPLPYPNAFEWELDRLKSDMRRLTDAASGAAPANDDPIARQATFSVYVHATAGEITILIIRLVILDSNHSRLLSLLLLK